MTNLKLIALAAVGALLLAGCASVSENTSTSSRANPGGSTEAAAPASTNPYPAPASTVSVPASGSTFVAPLVSTWAYQYATQQPTVQVSYGGGGSGKGRTDIINRNTLFSGTDAPMSPAEKAAANTNGANVLMFPESLGPVAVVYNVNGIPAGAQLDGETIGKIYAGAISNWKDTGIANAPDASIAIVYRSDSSGTTFTFTDFLARASPTFASKVSPAASSKPDWTKSSAQQLAGNGNDGVSSTVKNTPNSIGYVDLSYALALGLKTAAVKSHDGEFLLPTTDGAANAAAGFASSLPAPDGDWSKVSIAYAPGAGAYPISTFTYIMVLDQVASYGGKVSSDQMAGFKAWMFWCLHDGQSYSGALGYAPLPSSVVSIGEKALTMIH